ncbi:MAG TPA: hypothetical protein VHG30_05380 [Microvirga sp.]|nr:hypothetical protein [Microvirga sp.]
MVWEFGYQSSQSRAHTGELLVQFAPGARAAQHKAAAASIGGTVREIIQTAAMEDTGAGDLVRITIGNGLSAERAIEIVSKRSDVAFAEPNVFSAQATSNDPYYTNDSLWGMHGDYSGATRIEHGSRANEVWTKEYLGSTRVAVGIVDNGIH